MALGILGSQMVRRDQLTTELLQKVTELSGKDYSRRQLSRFVCESLNWRGPSGALQVMGCRKLLRDLEKKQVIKLEPPKRKFLEAKPIEAYAAASIKVKQMSQLGPIELRLVPQGSSAQGRLWNQIMVHHPLGPGPLCGAQLRYLIQSPGGWLGGLAFSAAARHVKVRDEWIGWTQNARVHHLHQVVNNSRFLILPQVRAPHLASHVLAQATRRLAQDWWKRYGYNPVLVETYVQSSQHQGHCYRAANWDLLGLTSGRGRQDSSRQKKVGPKSVWVYLLRRDGLKHLRQEPPAAVSHHQGSNWLERECGRAELPGRLLKRLQMIMADFFARPLANIPQACGSWAKTKAVYRFFKNPKVTKEIILPSHYEETAARVAEQKIVLAVQDTTFLDYSTHRATGNLGPIGSASKDQALGLVCHGTLAFSPTGLPLGLIDLQTWARDPEDFGKRHRRKQLPIEEKESFKWIKSFRKAQELQERCPQTRIVSVGDRESDIYELFLETQKPGAPALLVRAERDRGLSQEEGLLWQKMQGQPVQTEYELDVPAGKNRTARRAAVEVRFASVTLRPPQRLRKRLPIALWAVYVVEVGTQPNEKEKLEWMLLTTLEVKTVEDALRVIDYYKQRWGIERFHKVLKSGCRIEDRQLGNATSLEACLAIDAMVAWRIYYACHLAREVPEAPCTIFFEDAEWKAMTAFRKRQRHAAEKPPTLQEMVNMVAKLGGWLERKSDGHPGTESLWRGFQRMDDIKEAWNAFGPEAALTVFSPTDYG